MTRVEHVADGVSLLTMDDGKVNAISPAFLETFRPAWAEAAKGGRAVVLAGNAKAFSAGLDLKVLPTLERDELVDFSRAFVRLFGEIATYPRPVVAAVEGPALAGGAILALCADLRIVGPKAKLGLTEMIVGIPVPPPLLDLVREVLPANEVVPAVMQAVVRQGEECVRTGWAHQYASENTLQKATEAAGGLAAASPLAYRVTKSALHPGFEARLAAFEKAEGERWVDLLMEPETTEAVMRYFASLRK
ncbi:MAG: enoyl-CoA hydratase/isomerase family protein [Methanobacteriota archaeon]